MTTNDRPDVREPETTSVGPDLSRNMLDSVLERLPAIMFFKDVEGRYLRASRYFLELIGAKGPGDLIGHHDLEGNLPPGEAARFRAEEVAMLRGEIDGIDHEEEIESGRGERRWFKTTKGLLLDEGGTVLGTFGVGLDITARKTAEADARRAQEVTHAANLELSRALDELAGAQNELLQARKLEAIGQLAAGVAHEINTPIQFIADNTSFVGSALDDLVKLLAVADEAVAELERAGAAPSVAERYRGLAAELDVGFLAAELPLAIGQTMEGTNRVAEIVRALKDFAHPSGAEKVDFDLNHAVQTTVSVSRSEWKLVADIEENLEPDLPTVPALPGPIHQALLIILVNAAQAIAGHQPSTRKGRIIVTTSHDDRWVEVTIADDGPGMSTATAERIFEPFFTTKSPGTGSGQGLSIAHAAVVKRHGGSITVYSRPGAGAAFRIKLPRRPESDTVAPPGMSAIG
jgi:PAS domain S-box-containing protein